MKQFQTGADGRQGMARQCSTVVCWMSGATSRRGSCRTYRTSPLHPLQFRNSNNTFPLKFYLGSGSIAKQRCFKSFSMMLWQRPRSL